MSTAYFPRELAGPVAEALDEMPVVVVTGMRQAGKTTFLQQDPALRGRRYLSLDDFATLEAARRDPEALLADPEPLSIDEAQRCPSLLTALKRVVDRDRRPGRFLLTGSANFALLRGVSETLAGRALYLVLDPFTRRERAGSLGSPPFLVRLLEDPTTLPRGARLPRLESQEILRGGLPAVALEEVRRRDPWFRGYEQTYLERDLRDLAQVADLVAFRRLLRLVALRTGQILNVSHLARDAALSTETASRWLGLLETSFVATRLPPFLRSRISRLVKSPKLFVTDSGLAAHLVAVRDLGAEEEPLRGALLETYVAQNLAATLRIHRPEAELCFWHVQGRHEVDFVVAARRRALGIEVKSGARFDERDLAGLRAFLAHSPDAKAGILAYDGEEAVSLGERLFAVPFGALLA